MVPLLATRHSPLPRIHAHLTNTGYAQSVDGGKSQSPSEDSCSSDQMVLDRKQDGEYGHSPLPRIHAHLTVTAIRSSSLNNVCVTVPFRGFMLI